MGKIYSVVLFLCFSLLARSVPLDTCLVFNLIMHLADFADANGKN